MLIDVAITHPLITTPDEDPRALEALMIALGEELSPRSHLERRQVELIAYSEWEIMRHRRFSARLLAHEAQRVSAEALREERSRLLTPKADHNANRRHYSNPKSRNRYLNAAINKRRNAMKRLGALWSQFSETKPNSP